MTKLTDLVFDLFCYANKVELAPGNKLYRFVEEDVFKMMPEKMRDQELELAQVAGIHIEQDIAYFTEEQLRSTTAYLAFGEGYSGRTSRYQQDNLAREDEIDVSQLSIQLLICHELYDLAIGRDPRDEQVGKEAGQLLMATNEMCQICSYIIEHPKGFAMRGNEHLLDKPRRTKPSSPGPRILKFPGT